MCVCVCVVVGGEGGVHRFSLKTVGNLLNISVMLLISTTYAFLQK